MTWFGDIFEGWRHRGRRALFGAVLVTAGLGVAVAAGSAHATTVEEVVSPGGIKAWLVSEPSIPFISLAMHIKGGSALDPEGREGLAYMVAGLLDEGAGQWDSQAFRAELEDNAIRLSFDADRDAFTGNLKTLNENREHAFELLRVALTEPRFDAEPVERIRQQVIAGLTRRQTDPNYLAMRAWFETAFAGHPYARPVQGTIESISAIQREDLVRFQQTVLARDRLVIGVAGDITAEELGPLLDIAFGGLPETSPLPELPPAELVTSGLEVRRMAVPQSVVVFGHKGIARDDPDYYAAHVANYILGGGGFSSRLLEEVREKRGLAYSVYSYLYRTDLVPLWMGGVATRNDQVAQSIDIIRKEVARIAEEGVTEDELKDAITYLTGSFPLRLASNDQLARTLVAMQVSDLGIDYLERHDALIEAVTAEDVARAARRVFAGDLLVSVVGDPVGLGEE